MNPEAVSKLKRHLSAAKALKEALDTTIKVPNRTPWPFPSYRVYLQKYNYIATEVSQLTPVTMPIDRYDIDKLKGPFDTTGIEQQLLLDGVYANLTLLIAFIEHTIGLKADEIQSLSDFFQANLRRAVFEKPEKESEIQNVIEQLLIGRGLSRGIDYVRESGRVQISIKEVIPDFVIPRLALAIETKLSKDRPKSKEIVDEINADIQSYGKKYGAVIFIVYDLGTIQDEAQFRLGLDSTATVVRVLVVKH